MFITDIKEIEPELSRCISVGSDDRLFRSGGSDGNSYVSHNSVLQRNIIFSCIMRPDDWFFLGIDLKRVELSKFRKYRPTVLGVATELSDALEVLRFASQTMMSRYSKMEELGVTDFQDLPDKGKALLVLIDEMGELLSPGGKAITDEAKEMETMKGEAQVLIGSIARLGRAAGVHIVGAAQRPDATIIPGETRSNFAGRVGCGNLKSATSQMLLESSEGVRINGSLKGRIYVQLNGIGNHAQGFFAGQSWIDDWLESRGLSPDGKVLGNDYTKEDDAQPILPQTLDDLDDDGNIKTDKKVGGIEPVTIPSDASFDSVDYDDDDEYEDDDDFSFEDNEDGVVLEEGITTVSPVSAPQNQMSFAEEHKKYISLAKEQDDTLGDLSFGKNKRRNYGRPEDDWDSGMDFITGTKRAG